MAQENQKEVNDMDGIGVRKEENNKVRLSRITVDPPQIRVLVVDSQRILSYLPFCPARRNLILDYERLFNFMNTNCLIISFDFAHFFT